MATETSTETPCPSCSGPRRYRFDDPADCPDCAGARIITTEASEGASSMAYDEAAAFLRGDWDERGTATASVSRQTARSFLASRGWLEESQGTWRRPEHPGPSTGAGYRFCRDTDEAITIELTAQAFDYEAGR